MKLKKCLTTVLALFLLVSMLFGCDKAPTVVPEPEGQTEDPGNQTTTELPTLTINGVALNDYTVVYNKTNISGGEEAYSYLNKKINELYGVTLKSSTAIKDRYEILIGLDGGDNTIAEEYKKSPDGFIGVSGKKIFLMGVNYGALCQVIDSFLAKAAGTDANKEISMTASENVNIQKSSIKVLTYNLQEDLNKEGRRSDCISEMIATIKTQDPDVFGTQENTAELNNGLIAGLSEYSYYQGAVLNDTNKRGNYVYWKTDKFNVVNKGYFYMSATPGVKSKIEGSNSYRSFTYLILEDKETGKQFLFVDIHTHYKYDSDNIPEETVRTKQLEVVSALLKRINKDNLPTVILGDFNTTPTGDAMVSFLQDNPTLALTSKIAKTKGDTGGTLAVTQFTVRDSYIFDHILVSTDNINTVYYSVVDNIKDGKYPSDHLPVVAHIDIY